MTNGFDWQACNELIADIESGETDKATGKVRDLRVLICQYERTIDSYRETLRQEFTR